VGKSRDKRDDKVKKPKKSTKLPQSTVQITEVAPPVEVVRKKRKEPAPDED
jgi:hypothetical protein